MAEKRMFAKTIIDSDSFMDMPLTSQLLYFHLAMRADDDGFINNPKKVQRMVGCSDDDLKMLIFKRFLIPFESGVVVIKHWRLHNYIQKDRYKPTVYQEELKSLTVKSNGSYTDSVYSLDTECIQDVSSLETQIRLDKIRLDKVSIFNPPTVDEVTSYCQERGNSVDPVAFHSFYESKGWLIGKNKMKNWKSAVITWERNTPKSAAQKKQDQFEWAMAEAMRLNELEAQQNATR